MASEWDGDAGPPSSVDPEPDPLKSADRSPPATSPAAAPPPLPPPLDFFDDDDDDELDEPDDELSFPNPLS